MVTVTLEGRGVCPVPHLALCLSSTWLFPSRILFQETGDLVRKCFSEFHELL